MDKTSSSFKVMNNKDLLTLIFSYFRDKPSKICRLNKKVIEEKYIRYEFSYWDEREIEKEFG